MTGAMAMALGGSAAVSASLGATMTVGAVSGGAAGFVGGAMGAWLNGGDFWDGIGAGVMGMTIGAVAGAATAGLSYGAGKAWDAMFGDVDTIGDSASINGDNARGGDNPADAISNQELVAETKHSMRNLERMRTNPEQVLKEAGSINNATRKAASEIDNLVSLSKVYGAQTEAQVLDVVQGLNNEKSLIDLYRVSFTQASARFKNALAYDPSGEIQVRLTRLNGVFGF